MKYIDRLTPLQLDVAIAAIAALFVIIITPGLAITALVGLLVLLVCGITILGGRLRRRHRNSGGPRGGRRTPTRSAERFTSAEPANGTNRLTGMPRTNGASRKPRSRRREPPVRRVPPGRI